jgi:hypothetical protein
MDGELIDLGTVAAANIARSLGLGEDKVGAIRDAIRDEIAALSAQFTLAFADISAAHELKEERLRRAYNDQVYEIRSAHRFVEDNLFPVLTVLAAVFAAGSLATYLAML